MRNIEAKMAAFTDAGLYEQDAHIDFEPEPIMDSIIHQIIAICQEKDLGHQLLL